MGRLLPPLSDLHSLLSSSDSRPSTTRERTPQSGYVAGALKASVFKATNRFPAVCVPFRVRSDGNTMSHVSAKDYLRGACCEAVVRLLASNQGEPGSMAGGATPGFSHVESCRTMKLVGGFSQGFPVPSALAYRRCSAPASNHPPVRMLTSYQCEPDSIPGAVAPRFSHMGIVSDDATAQWVFSGISRFPRPCIPAPLHTHLASPLSCLKT
ncbi:hypothetical protein PR048_016379 [Dryococelus australis]|uniref:Uncharacterized protein n=1 Tax=Dryococelus australis TaxID=614101 RepID=A0ABQ9HJL2_9NEOP|nr:hypothetical protein PR048_016379 [Dryococelus australis]